MRKRNRLSTVLWEFLQFVSYGAGLMSGVLSICREAYSLMHPSDAVGQSRNFWLSVRLAFVISAAASWLLQYRKTLLAETHIEELKKTLNDLTKPLFKLTLGQCGHFYEADKNVTGLLLSVTLTNQGADGSVAAWKGLLIDKQGRKHVIAPTLLGNDMPIPNGSLPFVLKKGELLFHKSLTPIPRGGQLAGRVLYIIEGNHEAGLEDGSSEIHIYVTDVFGGVAEARFAPSVDKQKLMLFPREVTN